MKFLTTQKFYDKILSVVDDDLYEKLLAFIDRIESITDVNEIINMSSISFNDIYVYRLEDYRLFFFYRE